MSYGWLAMSVQPKGRSAARDRDEQGRLPTDHEFTGLFLPRDGAHRARIGHFGLLRLAEQQHDGTKQGGPGHE
jgi:hypothetical protein